MLKTRIITATILGAIVLWVLLGMDKCFVIGLMSIGCGICSYELMRMLEQKKNEESKSSGRLYSLVISLGSVLSFIMLSYFSLKFSLVLSLAVFILGVCILIFRSSDIESLFARISGLCLNVFYIVGMWYFIYLVYNVSVNYLLLLFCIIWGSDIGGYFGGRMFGKHLLSSKISPKKTIEGAISSMITAIVLVLSLKGVLGIEFCWLVSTMIAVIVCFVGICGDLLESVVKRFCGVKDSGNILPGHGGLLDRVDALLLGAPIFYLFLIVLNIV